MNDLVPAAKMHSLFGASQAHRYLHCAGSTLLIASLQGGEFDGSGQTSSYAAAGTAKHHLVELCLRKNRDAESYRGSTVNADGYGFTVDDEFISDVTICVNAVRSLIARGFDVELEINVTPPISFSQPVLPSGTADVIAFLPMLGRLVVIDYKFGRGVFVDEIENPQFIFYASGALTRLIAEGNVVRSVEMWVIQPGIESERELIRKTSMTPDEIAHWAENTLAPGIEASLVPDAPLVVGDHCRFCVAKLVCPAQKRHAQELARIDFADCADDAPVPPVPAPPEMTNDEIAVVLRGGIFLRDWLDTVEAEATARLEANKKIPGWALEPKRATRKWSDEQAAYEVLIGAGHAPYDVTKTELLSPAQLEKKSKAAYSSVKAFVDAAPSGIRLARRALLTDGNE